MNSNIDISKLPLDVKKEYLQLKVKYSEKLIQVKAKEDFLSFVKCVWPEFVEGAHHRHIAKKFNQLAKGEINRLIINMPPRHTNLNLHLTYYQRGWWAVIQNSRSFKQLTREN